MDDRITIYFKTYVFQDNYLSQFILCVCVCEAKHYCTPI